MAHAGVLPPADFRCRPLPADDLPKPFSSTFNKQALEYAQRPKTPVVLEEPAATSRKRGGEKKSPVRAPPSEPPDPQRVRAAFAAKADGAWYLHKHTQGDDLAAFVMYSSLSALIGNPGQVNYASANAFGVLQIQGILGVPNHPLFHEILTIFATLIRRTVIESEMTISTEITQPYFMRSRLRLMHRMREQSIQTKILGTFLLHSNRS